MAHFDTIDAFAGERIVIDPIEGLLEVYVGTEQPVAVGEYPTVPFLFD